MNSTFQTITIDNYSLQVIDKSFQKLVLLDISAQWCAPCVLLFPILEQLSQHFNHQFQLAKLEAADEEMKIAGLYNVRGFPTVIFIKNGEEQTRFQGVQSFSKIESLINQYL